MDSQDIEYREIEDESSEDEEMSEHDPPPSLGLEQENTEGHTGTTGSDESDAIDEIILFDRYRLEYAIGAGAYGAVYSATDLVTNREVAVKLAQITQSLTLSVRNEYQLAQQMATYTRPPPPRRPSYVGRKGREQGWIGFPDVHFYGIQDSYEVLVTEMCGPSLEDLRKFCGGRLNLKTVILIAIQALTRLTAMSKEGVLHRDLKPANMLFGSRSRGNVLQFIDFGMAKTYARAQPYFGQGNRRGVGTAYYSPLAYHAKQEQSYKDDVKNMAYVLVYLAKGELPWPLPLPDESNCRYLRRMGQAKRAMTAYEICEGLPVQFARLLESARELKQEDVPPYDRYLGWFKRLLTREGFSDDNVFDWTQRIHDQMMSTVRR